MNARMLIVVVVSMFVCQQVHAQVEDDPVMPEATELEGTREEVSIVARSGVAHARTAAAILAAAIGRLSIADTQRT